MFQSALFLKGFPAEGEGDFGAEQWLSVPLQSCWAEWDHVF